jgi:hypothetical protein
MKYRDIITIFLTIIFILMLAYTLGADRSLWYISLITFIVLVFIFYKLWIEK